jgi:hypothetical protein
MSTGIVELARVMIIRLVFLNLPMAGDSLPRAQPPPCSLPKHLRYIQLHSHFPTAGRILQKNIDDEPSTPARDGHCAIPKYQPPPNMSLL